MAERRSRCWATILYEESVLPEWQEYLAETHIQAFCSPLHDKDKDKEGNPKKPHYHLMMMFEGKKSESQLSDILYDLKAVGLKNVMSIRGYARYLCHLDEDESVKAHYNPADVKCFAGANYQKYLEDENDSIVDLSNVISQIKDSKVRYFADFVDENYDCIETMNVLRSNTYFICEYIKSKREKWKDENLDNVSGKRSRDEPI